MSPISLRWKLLPRAATAWFVSGVVWADPANSDQWPTVAGEAGGTRYSALGQIDPSNVARLQPRWSYRHRDFRSGWPETDVKGTVFEATPILAHGKLIFSTPFNRVIALDPESGRELWSFDPRIDLRRRYPKKMVSRGIAY